MGKVAKKLVAKKLAQFYKANDKFHKCQMRAKKNLLATDTTAILVQKVQNICNNWQIAEILLINIKYVFGYVLPTKLVYRMADLDINDNLIEWTQFFLIDRWIELVIDKFINPKYKVQTGISQGSSVSSILLLIYISGVFLEL